MTKQEIKAGLSTGQDLRCKPFVWPVAQIDYQKSNDRFSYIRFQRRNLFMRVSNFNLYFIKPE